MDDPAGGEHASQCQRSRAAASGHGRTLPGWKMRAGPSGRHAMPLTDAEAMKLSRAAITLQIPMRYGGSASG